jgi:hypothetical protein
MFFQGASDEFIDLDLTKHSVLTFSQGGGSGKGSKVGR